MTTLTNEPSSVTFYCAQLGCNREAARMVADVMEIATNSPAVTSAHPWTAGDLVRVYLELWSQNNMQALHFGDKVYFDCSQREVMAKSYFLGCAKPVRSLLRMKKHGASGARTREAISTFLDQIDAKKTDWD